MKTILDFFEPWPARLSLIIFCGAVAMLSYNWINWSSLTASDWGTWVGAIGTIGALVGTIWLATSSERLRVREARARAFVACASIGLKVADTQEAVDSVIEYLEDEFEIGYAVNVKMLSDRLKNSGQWSDEEILPLIFLNSRVTAHLATIRTSIGYTRFQLDEVAQIQVEFRVDPPMVIDTILSRMRKTQLAIAVAATEIDRFMDTHQHASD